MIFRILVGAGLLALGYYVGREIGRTESVREELRKARHTPSPPPSPARGEGVGAAPKRQDSH